MNCASDNLLRSLIRDSNQTQYQYIISRPVGLPCPLWTLLAIRHQTVQNKTDLAKVYVTNKRIWLRIRDPSSTKQKFTFELAHCSTFHSVDFWPVFHETFDAEEILTRYCSRRYICCRRYMRNWEICEIRCGLSSLVSGILFHSDFAQLNINLNSEMQRSISSFETLAEIALLYVTARVFELIACSFA